jgi:hypothetical protein
VLTEDSYRIVVDQSQPIEKRFEAFHTRPNWLRSLYFEAPRVEQVNEMVPHFGELGLIERRERDSGAEFPQVMYVETLAPDAGPLAAAAASHQQPQLGPSLSPEVAFTRFPRLRR